MSGKISLGIGKSPCSNGSRRGWITELEFGFGVGAGSGLGSVVDVVSAVMVFQRERERERLVILCFRDLGEMINGGFVRERRRVMVAVQCGCIHGE